MGLTSVRSLVDAICPATIARLIVPVRVDAIQSLTFRPFTHIGEEVRELGPALADGDTAPAVVLELLMALILAALTHSPPSIVGRTTGPRERVSVRVGSRPTTTRNGVPISEITNADNDDCTAIATAFPTPLPPFDVVDAMGRQKTKSLIGNVARIGHQTSFGCLSRRQRD